MYTRRSFRWATKGMDLGMEGRWFQLLFLDSSPSFNAPNTQRVRRMNIDQKSSLERAGMD